MEVKELLKNKKFWLGINIFLVILALVLTVYFFTLVTQYKNIVNSKINNKISDINNGKVSESCTDCAVRMIDGQQIKKGEENIFPIAVTIENHIDSRPASGLSKANLVYETEVEGGITRFLAFFASNENIPEIGPVRSARSYFVDYVKEMSPLFAHVGGSPDALVRIAKENILDLNEFYNQYSFWRDELRSAPHNVYTSSELLKEYTNKKELYEGKFLSWKYKTEADEAERPQANSIVINYKLGFIVEWKYEKESNSFLRIMDDEIHKDKEGNEIRAKNVIVITVPSEVIDEELRLKMETIGENSAVICLDGICSEGKWKKTSASSRIRFYNNEDSEIELNPGTTWVEVVRPEIVVTY